MKKEKSAMQLAVDLLPAVKSIRERLKAILGAYAAQAGNTDYANLYELSEEAFKSLGRAAKNLCTMAKMECEMNEHARKFNTGPEITECQKLLAAVSKLPEIINVEKKTTRDLLIARIKELLTAHGKPSIGSMRWYCVFEYACDRLDLDIKYQGKGLKLEHLDYSTFDDAALVEFFELVNRQFYTQM